MQGWKLEEKRNRRGKINGGNKRKRRRNKEEGEKEIERMYDTGIFIMQNTMVRGGGNGQPGKK